MASSFLRFLYHTQRRTPVGRTPLAEWSARRRDLYLTTHNIHNRQTSMPPVGFEPTISEGERPQTNALDRAAAETSLSIYKYTEINLNLLYLAWHLYLNAKIFWSFLTSNTIYINMEYFRRIICTLCNWRELGRAFPLLDVLNPLNAELNPICYLLALLAHHFLHVSRISVKSLPLRWLMSYIYGAPILDVSRSHTTTQHSR